MTAKNVKPNHFTKWKILKPPWSPLEINFGDALTWGRVRQRKKNPQIMLFHRIPVNNILLHIYPWDEQIFRWYYKNSVSASLHSNFTTIKQAFRPPPWWLPGFPCQSMPVSALHVLEQLDKYSWLSCAFWLWGVYALAEHAYTLAAH